jgi:DNA-binding NarL/FixJ family response regulator
MATLRVLLVEGHHGVRDALARRLERIQGLELIGAVEDVPAALSCLARQPSAVVLCDPRSLSDTPATVVQRLRQVGAAIVVLTTSLIETDANDFLAAGAAAVLLKGCTMQAIHATLLAAAKEGARLPSPRVRRPGSGAPSSLAGHHVLAK